MGLHVFQIVSGGWSFSVDPLMAEELAEGPGRSQEFGDAHTVAKLDALRGYLTAYTALGKMFRLHYVDAFAGSGSCDVRVSDGSRRTIQGSARIAIETSPASDRAHCKAQAECPGAGAARPARGRSGDQSCLRRCERSDSRGCPRPRPRRQGSSFP
jgi:hypothetical protein